MENTAPTFTVGGTLTNNFGSSASGQSVTIQDDGKILVAGTTETSPYNSAFALARYNTDGTLDTTFDTDGMATTNFGSYASGYSVTIQADGKILVAGTAYNGLALARYNTDGTLDTTFDTDGMLTNDFGSSASGRSVTIQDDGKILVAGTAYNGLALARYNTDGTLDTTFDTDGMLTNNFGSWGEGYSVTTQTDGKILVAGQAYSYITYTNSFALARYNNDGTLDTSFDSDGMVVTTDFGPYTLGRSVTVQDDGKILVLGASNDGGFALARYKTDGTLDTTFDSDGMLTNNFGSWARGYSVTTQTDGKILVAGAANNEFALARYNTDGTLDTTFDSDGMLTNVHDAVVLHP